MDITNEESFTLIKELFKFIKQNFGNNNITFYIVFNKYDKNEERQLTNFEINEFEDENKGNFEKFEISLKDKKNLESLFQRINESLSASSNSIVYSKNLKENIVKIEGSLNIVIVGDSGVGKTQLFLRFFSNTFTTIFSSTIGMDRSYFSVKKNNKLFKVIINDTAGQERFRSLPKRYYHNSDGVLLLIDLSQRNSFENVKGWIEDINDSCDNKIIIYIVGNKIDLANREVSYEEAENLAKSYGLQYFEMSCKTNINIEEIIFRLVSEIFKNFIKNKAFSIKKLKPKKKNVANETIEIFFKLFI